MSNIDIFCTMPSVSTIIGSDDRRKKAVSTCLKMRGPNRELSVCFDNSLGALKDMSRADIRLYDEDGAKDVTAKVFGHDSTVPCTMENFNRALKWLQE